MGAWSGSLFVLLWHLRHFLWHKSILHFPLPPSHSLLHRRIWIRWHPCFFFLIGIRHRRRPLNFNFLFPYFAAMLLSNIIPRNLIFITFYIMYYNVFFSLPKFVSLQYKLVCKERKIKIKKRQKKIWPHIYIFFF